MTVTDATRERLGWHLETDLCIVGAGMSGVSCAVTAARFGLRVVLADACPWVGGQAVGVPIGTLAGLYSCGSRETVRLLSPLFAQELLERLLAREACWPLYSQRARTLVIVYDEADLERTLEQLVVESGVTLLLGAVVYRVTRDDRQVSMVDVATRFGSVRVRADWYVDASGDAALVALAGGTCHPQPEHILGTQMAVLDGVQFPEEDDPAVVARRAEELLRDYGPRYGLTRRECRVFPLPQHGMVVLNATHLPTPLDPIAFWQLAQPARREADAAAQLLRAEYPEVFGRARLRRLGYPGIRQTRTIVGRTTLTLEDVQRGRIFPDAIARAAWPIELHDSQASYRWEPWPDGHLYTIPYGALLPVELDNVLAIGRCIDADPWALSSARVMGPCVAMGVAAAHAVHLARTLGVHLPQVDMARLQAGLRPNLEDLPPQPA